MFLILKEKKSNFRHKFLIIAETGDPLAVGSTQLNHFLLDFRQVARCFCCIFTGLLTGFFVFSPRCWLFFFQQQLYCTCPLLATSPKSACFFPFFFTKFQTVIATLQSSFALLILYYSFLETFAYPNSVFVLSNVAHIFFIALLKSRLCLLQISIFHQLFFVNHASRLCRFLPCSSKSFSAFFQSVSSRFRQ
jgi:hypothetical protein